MCPFLAAHAAGDPVVAISPAVKNSIESDGRARVIVRLRTAEPPAAGRQTSAEREHQRQFDITTRQQRLRESLRGTKHSIRHEFRSLPYVVVEVDAAALARLERATADVAQIGEDLLVAPTLADSIPQIEADIAHQQGFNGSGAVIAIVDTGVDNTHPLLAGRVIDEACFADREEPEDPPSCPNGGNQQFGTGAAVPCPFAPSTCRHGTHVAGIAAGAGDTPGVAPSANLFALQVFHRSTACGFEAPPCARAFISDITAALEYLYEQRDLYNLASVNMSLGSLPAVGACDAVVPELTAVIGNLKAAGVATVISSGNGSERQAISVPACIAAAVSVGAVDDDDSVASFSNVGSELDLFAPGVGILSSVPGGGFASLSGTSMAAPHVAGAWAVMRQANPLASVDEVLGLFVETGRPIFDGRSGGSITRPRIRLGAALGIEAPLPVLLSISPAALRAESGAITLTVLGSGFVRASVVRLNGVPRATVFVSETELRAQVTASDLQTQATSIAVSVVTPPPGGGSSATLSLVVLQPSLTVDRTTASPGTSVTVTLNDGRGVWNDWIAFARVGDPAGTYLNTRNVGEGNSTLTWTITTPATGGDYEFRLFRGGTFTRIATSPTVTVTGPPPPPPPPPPSPDPPTLTVSTTVASPGTPITVTMTNGTGVWNDWLAFARVGDPNGTYLNWRNVGAGNITLAWTINLPAAAGSYEFRLFRGGTFTRIATSPTVTVTGALPPPPPPPSPDPPTLTVSTTVANPGAPVTVTMTNGTGVWNDWLAFARVGDPNGTYLKWRNVGTGNITLAWTVNMPATTGTYEFRLFRGGTFTRIATSPAISVVPAVP
jgi:hypothetical protein